MWFVYLILYLAFSRLYILHQTQRGDKTRLQRCNINREKLIELQRQRVQSTDRERCMLESQHLIHEQAS